MDHRLVAWAGSVKSRRRGTTATRGAAARPVLWLFTDAARVADPLAAAARLPRGAAGIVLRDDGHPDRAALARRLARVCRGRRLALSIAGDWRLAVLLHAGVHLRGGRRPAHMPRWVPAATSSAHGWAEVRRARRAGAALVFLSPVFATASHPTARTLGPVRWGLTGRHARGLAALGGIDGHTVRRLPDRCRAIGAIGALA